MLMYVCEMKTKSIPWEVIDSALSDMRKDASWLRTQLGVGANVITNWKSRGVPKNRAAELAGILQTTSDYLLQRPGAAKVAQPIPKETALDMAVELLTIFRRCSYEDQIRILEAARTAEKLALLNGSPRNDAQPGAR